MTVVVSIEGTDRTRFVEYSSLKITQTLTTEPDSAQFVIRKFGSRTYVPSVNEEVIITQNGTKKFAGHVIQVDEEYDKLDTVSYLVQCTDYTRHMDARLVAETFEGLTVAQIISQIIGTYTPNDITTTNVNVTTVIDKFIVNYEYPSEVFRQLAEVTDSDWYIDYDKDIHFNHKKDVAAPFDLTDTNGKYVHDSLVIRRDLSQLRNIIVVRGGEYLGDTTTVAFDGDGTRSTFFLPYKISDLTLTVSGQEKSVGIDPVDLPDNYDALHNFNEKFIRMRSDKVPSNGAAVRIGGKPNLPVIVKQKDQSSVGLWTAREYLVVDKTLQSKEAARERALAELVAFKTTLSEGQFSTYQTTMRPGEVINVQSDLRSIDEDFVINKVITRIFAVDGSDNSVQFVSQVHLMTTRTFDYISLLRNLLNRNKKEIEINENEVVDTVETILEELTLSESVSVATAVDVAETLSLSEVVTSNLDYGEEYVLGPWTSGYDEDTPSVKKRLFILDGSPLG